MRCRWSRRRCRRADASGKAGRGKAGRKAPTLSTVGPAAGVIAALALRFLAPRGAKSWPFLLISCAFQTVFAPLMSAISGWWT